MTALEPEVAESSVAAALPADIAVWHPSADLPDWMGLWAGEWSEWAGQGRSHDIRITIESVSLPDVIVVCVRASNSRGAFSERLLARFHGNELQGQLTNGAKLCFRLRNPDVMEILWHETDGHWSAGVLSQQSPNGQRLVERVSTGVLDQGREITLEMV